MECLLCRRVGNYELDFHDVGSVRNYRMVCFVMIEETSAIAECGFQGLRGFLCRPYRALY